VPLQQTGVGVRDVGREGIELRLQRPTAGRESLLGNVSGVVPRELFDDVKEKRIMVQVCRYNCGVLIFSGDHHDYFVLGVMQFD